MKNSERLNYEVMVAGNLNYTIKMECGDAQPGNHKIIGLFNCNPKPEGRNPKWESALDRGENLKGKKLRVSTVTGNKNPDTNWVSLRIWINEVEIISISGNSKKEIPKDETMFFVTEIKFL